MQSACGQGGDDVRVVDWQGKAGRGVKMFTQLILDCLKHLVGSSRVFSSFDIHIFVNTG